MLKAKRLEQRRLKNILSLWLSEIFDDSCFLIHVWISTFSGKCSFFVTLCIKLLIFQWKDILCNSLKFYCLKWIWAEGNKMQCNTFTDLRFNFETLYFILETIFHQTFGISYVENSQRLDVKHISKAILSSITCTAGNIT